MNKITKDKETLDTIKSCVLFEDMSEKELYSALEFFDARLEEYRKGDFVQSILMPFERFGLVLSGTVQVYMDDIDGNNIIMANVSSGDTFGESLSLLHAESPVYIQATSPAKILMMSTANLNSTSQTTQNLKMRYSVMLARRALAMNDRIQVLSKITLREKIVTFLSQYHARSSSSTFSIPFDRASMAIYLGTDRASLSRELSKMKKDGIIDFNKNHFLIKKL